MSRSTWLSAATAASLVLLQHQTVANPPGSGWQLVFFDDFDGPAINETVWTVRDNFTHGGSEWELYMKDEVYTAMDGNTTALVMRTRVNPTPYGSRMYNWTSGWVDSAAKNQFTYGHFEFRAKLPDPSAQSVWPALWLVADGLGNGSTKCWPMGGEIDIMESVGLFQSNEIFGTYHWGETCGDDDWEKDKYNQNYPNASNPQINFSQDYHVFAATWTPSVMTWYVDGVPFVSRYPGVSNPPTLFIPSWPLYMIMNTAIANWAPSGMPQPPVWHTDTVYHYVDWVKVWQWSDSNEAEMLTAGSQ